MSKTFRVLSVNEANDKVACFHAQKTLTPFLDIARHTRFLNNNSLRLLICAIDDTHSAPSITYADECTQRAEPIQRILSRPLMCGGSMNLDIENAFTVVFFSRDFMDDLYHSTICYEHVTASSGYNAFLVLAEVLRSKGTDLDFVRIICAIDGHLVAGSDLLFVGQFAMTSEQLLEISGTLPFFGESAMTFEELIKPPEAPPLAFRSDNESEQSNNGRAIDILDTIISYTEEDGSAIWQRKQQATILT